MGRIFKCACVADVCPMTPRTKKKDCHENSQGGGRMRKFITCIRSYYRKKISLLVTSRKMLEITTRVLVLRNTQRVKFSRKRN